MGKKNSKPGVMLYFDAVEPLELLTDKQRGKLFLGLMHYARDGVDPVEELDKNSRLVWLAMRSNVDRDDEHYKKKVENAKRSVEKRETRRKIINDMLAESGELSEALRRNLAELPLADPEEEEKKQEECSGAQKLNPFEAQRQKKIRQLEESGY